MEKLAKRTCPFKTDKSPEQSGIDGAGWDGLRQGKTPSGANWDRITVSKIGKMVENDFRSFV